MKSIRMILSFFVLCSFTSKNQGAFRNEVQDAVVLIESQIKAMNKIIRDNLTPEKREALRAIPKLQAIIETNTFKMPESLNDLASFKKDYLLLFHPDKVNEWFPENAAMIREKIKTGAMNGAIEVLKRNQDSNFKRYYSSYSASAAAPVFSASGGAAAASGFSRPYTEPRPSVKIAKDYFFEFAKQIPKNVKTGDFTPEEEALLKTANKSLSELDFAYLKICLSWWKRWGLIPEEWR